MSRMISTLPFECHLILILSFSQGLFYAFRGLCFMLFVSFILCFSQYLFYIFRQMTKRQSWLEQK